MFSREEKKAFRKEFWTAFGVFMRKHTPLSHPKVKWLNYRTGVKDLYFRLEADGKKVRISIDLQHHDEGIRALFWEQWLELKKMLEANTDSSWEWEQEYYNPEIRQDVSRIGIEKVGLNCFNKEHWSEAFHFFEKYIVGLDEFWADFRIIFEDLDT